MLPGAGSLFHTRKNPSKGKRVPSLVDWTLFSDAILLVGLIISAACIALVADWRVTLVALVLQYLLQGLLLTGVVHSSVAMVRVLSGGMAAMIMFVTMQRKAADERAARRRAAENGLDAVSDRPSSEVFIVDFPFRLFAVALVAVAIIGLASSMTFFDLPAHILFSSLWLMSIGLLVAMLSRDALRLGLGIMLFTGGFCIVDTAIEGSLFLYGLLNITDLLIALAVAHLATLPSEPGANRRRGDMP